MKKIFIIDDSEASLYLLQSVFMDDSGIKVEIENNSAKAISEIKKGNPDVILLDLMMPHIDGFKILEQLKSDDKTKKIPVLVISARHDEEAHSLAKTYGVFDYIQKPLNLHEIRKKVFEALIQNQ